MLFFWQPPGISPNHTTSNLKSPPHPSRPERLDPDHSSPPQRGSLSVRKLLIFIHSSNDAANLKARLVAMLARQEAES